jgi:hypothetical protein
LISFSFTQGQTDTLNPDRDSTIKNNSSKDTLLKKNNFVPNKDLTIEIFEVDNSGINIDGDLSEPVWKNAKKYGNFSEVDPGDNTKPPVDTEVQMFYDKDNFYVAFTCYDSNMSKLRATMTDRDKMFNDDFVDVFFDPYAEGKQAYELVVNPYGVQGDLQWQTNGNEDPSLDIIWYSDAKIYKDKWTVEIAIPFKSIRFPDKNVQEWSIHLLRNHPREISRSQYSFVPINRDAPTLFKDHATLKGIRNVKSGNNLEILPYVLGTQAGNISDMNNADSKFENEKIKGKFGFNVKYGITSNLTTDFTYNPDFSQVEADEGQINVNTTFALFYTEKRPFFLEGSSIFETPMNVVYTRSINKPLFAAKTSGRIGTFDIGYVLAYDENTPFIVPFEEKSSIISTNKKSFSNIFRIKKNFKDESYLGFILTDREVRKDNGNIFDIDGFNRTFGIDGRIMMYNYYSLTFQFLGYQTRELNDSTVYYDPEKFDGGKYTGTFDGEKFTGFGSYVDLLRSAKYWNFSVSYNDASPVARRDNGFLENNNYKTFSTSQSYMFYPDGKIVQRIQSQIYGIVRHNYDGKLKEVFVEPNIWMKFAHQVQLSAGYFLVNNEDFGGVYNKYANRAFINLNVNTLENLSGSLYYEMGKYIIRQGTPYVGYGFRFEHYNTIKPFDKLTLENSYIYFELSKSYKGEKLFAGYLLRNKSTFQFNKNMFLRVIFQYDSFNKAFEIDPLFSYKLNPFTIFYVGSTHNFSELENLTGNTKYVETGRQIFLKLQYLWRM